MRKLWIIPAAVLLMSCVAMAGGIVTNGNQSAEYIRTLNRNASTEIDAVFYNPAGLTKLGDGFTFGLNNQSIFQTKEVKNDLGTLNQDTFEGDVKAYLFPDLYCAYKTGNLVFSAAFLPIGGGGSAEYAEGLPSFESLAGYVGLPASVLDPLLGPYGDITGYSQNAQFSGSSVYLSGQVGASYMINDMFSVALGGRYISAKNTYEGSITDMTLHTSDPLGMGLDEIGSDVLGGDVELDAKRTGTAYSGIVGLNIAPCEGVNVGLKYEHISKLEMENETEVDGTGLFTDGAKVNADIPGMFGLGLSYDLAPGIRAEAGFSYYLNSGVDWDGGEEFVDDGYDGGLGIEYTVNDALSASAGYLYTKKGTTADYQSDMGYELDSNSVGFGISYALNPGLELNLGAANTFYIEGDNGSDTVKETYNKNSFAVAVGFQYKM